MLRTNFILCLAIGGLIYLMCLASISAAPSQRVESTKSAQLADTAKNRCMVALVSTNSSKSSENAQDSSLVRLESINMTDTAKNGSMPVKRSAEIKDINSMLLPDIFMKAANIPHYPNSQKANKSPVAANVDHQMASGHLERSISRLLPQDNSRSNAAIGRPLAGYAYPPWPTKKPASVAPELITNYKNLYAAHDNSEDDQDEITLPMPEDLNKHFPLPDASIKIQPRGDQNYYPSGPVGTVCAFQSTVYNRPQITNWLKKKIYRLMSTSELDYSTQTFTPSQTWSRPIWLDLRRQLYTQGRSEECHNRTLTKWRPYLECALRRNQRMEYLIPKYPLHQIGFYAYFSRSRDESKFTNYVSYKPITNTYTDYWNTWD